VLPTKLHAQTDAPGYLGKKGLVIAYGALTPNLNRFLSSQEPLRVIGLPAFGVEWALNRRFTFLGQYGLFQVEESYDWRNRLGTLNLQGDTWRLGLRTYSFLQRGSIALVGPYQEISILFLRNRSQDMGQQLYPDGRVGLGTKLDVGIGIAIGSQRIFWDQLVLDISLKGNWLLGLQRPADVEVDIYLDDLLNRRLRRLFGFSIQGGIGWLIPNASRDKRGVRE